MRITLDLAADGSSVQVRAEYGPTMRPDRLADAIWQVVLEVLEGRADASAPDDTPDDEPTVEPDAVPSPRPPADLDDRDPDALRRRAMRLLDEGFSETEVCGRLGITTQRLRRWDDDTALDTNPDTLVETP